MNREILFRARQISDREWVEGDLIQEPNGVTQIQYYEPDSEKEGYFKKYKPIVDSDTVCQYTGLKDNDGKKIFEGDIVEYEDEAPGQYEYHDDLCINRGVVEYEEGTFYWTNAVSAVLVECVYKGIADCKVIGNIFDNPELLERT